MKTYNVEGTSYKLKPFYEAYKTLYCDVGDFTVNLLGDHMGNYVVYIWDNGECVPITKEYWYKNRGQAISKAKGLVRKLVRESSMRKYHMVEGTPYFIENYRYTSASGSVRETSRFLFLDNGIIRASIRIMPPNNTRDYYTVEVGDWEGFVVESFDYFNRGHAISKMKGLIRKYLKEGYTPSRSFHINNLNFHVGE